MFELTLDWPHPPWVKSFASTRHGGVSLGPWHSLNLGDHVGDNPQHVSENRQRVKEHTGVSACYLKQVHGIDVINLNQYELTSAAVADAAFVTKSNTAAVVLTADCMPLLFCHRYQKVVGVAHAGWRGLAAGVIHSLVNAMQVDASELMVWLGPTISQPHFEVGNEVREAFMRQSPKASLAFIKGQKEGKWYADLVMLARQQLEALGIKHIYGGQYCTYANSDLFYSHRRDQGITGRMGYFIWIDEEDV